MNHRTLTMTNLLNLTHTTQGSHLEPVSGWVPRSVLKHTQPPFRADAEAVADDQHANQQLRIDRRPPRLTVEGCQVCPNLIELNKAIDPAQQMCERYMPLERERKMLLRLSHCDQRRRCGKPLVGALTSA
jgi:hypothetical protein